MGRTTLETRFLEEEDLPLWRTFVDGASSGSVYSYPEYLEGLCRAAGGNPRILGVWKGDEIVGGVGLYERRSRGLRLVENRLLLYYNGLVVRDFDSKYPSRNTSNHLEIMNSLEEAISAAAYDHALLHNRHPIRDVRPFLRKGWIASPTYTYVMRLSDPDVAFETIDQNQRRLIRRCQEKGITVSDDDDFTSFFALHRDTAERKGAPQYLKEDAFRGYFRSIHGQGLGRLFHARTEAGRSVACQLVLTGSHPTTHTVAAAADPEFLNLGTTPFLRWKVCEQLASEGFEENDLTDAALNDVTRFKSQMGGHLTQNLVLQTRGSTAYRMNRAGSRALRPVRAGVRRVLRSITRAEG